MSKITNIHDKFFKEVLSDKGNAIDLIKGVMPKSIKENLNYSTLTLDTNSYMNKELKEHFSDIVYNCKYRKHKEIKIVFLFEHKSYFVEYPRFQILKYMLEIWQTNINQKEKLVPVIPIIVYHGKDKWNYKNLYEYFEDIDDNLKMFIPDFTYILSDLSSYTDGEIKDELFHKASLATSLLIMKNIHDENKLNKHLADYLNISRLYFEEEKGLKFLESLILYLYNAGDIGPEEIVEKITSISEKGGEKVMSTASRLIEKGRLEGLEKGIEKGRLEGIEKGIEKGVSLANIKTVKKMHSLGFSLDDISSVIDLPQNEIEKIILQPQ